MLERLAHLIHRKPWLWLAGWLLLAAAALPMASHLHEVLRAGGFENPYGEAARFDELRDRGFQDGGPALIVVYRENRDPGPASVEAALRGLSELKSVGPLPGASGAYRLTFAASENRVENLVPQIAKRLGSNAWVTGAPALDRALNIASKKSAQRAEMIAFPLMVAILFLVFRSARLTAIPLVVSGLVILLGSALGVLMGHHLALSILYENILSMLALALAVDYSLFIVNRYREEAALGQTKRVALERALATAGHSVLVSGFAVAVALAALFIPRIMVFSSIALGGIVATLFAMLAALTLLPAMLILFSPPMPATKPRPSSRALDRWLNGVSRRPGAVAVAVLLLLGSSALPLKTLSLHVPVASARSLPADDPARVGLEALTHQENPGRLFPIEGLVVGKDAKAVLAATRRIARAVAHDPALGAFYAPAKAGSGPLLRTRRGLTYARWIAIPKNGPNDPATRKLVERLRRVAKEASPSGVAFAVGGTTARGLDFDEALIAAVPWILGWVLLATLVLLFLAFRSLWVGLLGVGFNLLVTASTLGLLTLLKPLLGGTSVNSVTPILLFTVMFGLSMDYLVIMVSRIREAFLEGHAPEEAVRLGLGRATPLVNAAAVIMLSVFLAFGTAQVDVVQELGLGLAIAVALDAFFVRQTLLPAAFLLFGPGLWPLRKEVVRAPA